MIPLGQDYTVEIPASAFAALPSDSNADTGFGNRLVYYIPGGINLVTGKLTVNGTSSIANGAPFLESGDFRVKPYNGVPFVRCGSFLANVTTDTVGAVSVIVAQGEGTSGYFSGGVNPAGYLSGFIIPVLPNVPTFRVGVEVSGTGYARGRVYLTFRRPFDAGTVLE